MKATVIHTALVLAFVAPALLLGCKSKPVEIAPAPSAPVSRSFAGIWEGRDKSGTICSVRFTASEWEAHVEKYGAKMRLARGTYTFIGSTFDLTVLQEANPETQEWVPMQSYPKVITGRFAGGRLKIPNLTGSEEVDLVKKY